MKEFEEIKSTTLQDIEKGEITTNISVSMSKDIYTSFSSSEESNLLSDISETQPSVHEDKKWCCEKFFLIYFFNYDLTKNEYKKYNSLRRECLIMYDENNEEHERILFDFLDYFKEIKGVNKKGSNTIKWKNLGFQGENPRTDFRAGGFYSLRFMHYFAWKYPNETIKMTQLNYFLFAVVSIRLTYLIKLFINLVKDEDLQTSLKSHNIKSCTRKQFKNFCMMLSINPNILLILLSKFIIFIKDKFIEQYDENKNELNFLLIDPLIKRCLKCLENILNKYKGEEELDTIIDKYIKLELDSN